MNNIRTAADEKSGPKTLEEFFAQTSPIIGLMEAVGDRMIMVPTKGPDFSNGGIKMVNQASNAPLMIVISVGPDVKKCKAGDYVCVNGAIRHEVDPLVKQALFLAAEGMIFAVIPGEKMPVERRPEIGTDIPKQPHAPTVPR